MLTQIGQVPVIFAGKNIADVYFHHRCVDGGHRIGHSYRGMRVSAGIENNPVVIKSHLMKPVDELAFHIALKIRKRYRGKILFQLLQVSIKGLIAVNVFFPGAQKVEVGAVDYCYL